MGHFQPSFLAPSIKGRSLENMICWRVTLRHVCARKTIYLFQFLAAWRIGAWTAACTILDLVFLATAWLQVFCSQASLHWGGHLEYHHGYHKCCFPENGNGSKSKTKLTTDFGAAGTHSNIGNHISHKFGMGIMLISGDPTWPCVPLGKENAPQIQRLFIGRINLAYEHCGHSRPLRSFNIIRCNSSFWPTKIWG